jgi:hypothetical protein
VLNSRDRDSLDRYITGNYGEDQFEETFEDISGHEAAFHNTPFTVAYEYDPTDDGPECETITRILAKHPVYVLGRERKDIALEFTLDIAAQMLYSNTDIECT